ncbi:DNA ligase, ATP-dependent [Ophiocordyceps sinensis CO18]|uniref:DNA ligase, ATP-dependent n=1 Tax=Ophiocordyceps sinensis (strain Co18 / CGMCC 3.14243) TaxID=911162 RepID=T5A7X8_OPHSC|nr:DNA ligase, ATP-dependent [Ophiocordyceps sinensis CO18]
MPLQFSLVCDLLDECQRLGFTRRPNKQAIHEWFARNRGCIDAHDTDLSALLSTLLPEKRTDRVFCIQAPRLEKIIARALMLGSSRVAELARYKKPGLGLDLADCVERILATTPNPQSTKRGEITVEEIDDVLDALASKIRWSSPAIRSRAQCEPDALAGTYRRLGAREAKWFTRLILKDFQPLILESDLVYACCHPLLPPILKIYNDFATAIKVIRDVKGSMLPNSTRSYRSKRTALLVLKPQLGIKVGRQDWFKARSIKHCVNMGHGRMSVEEKIDGEFCQIHVGITGQSHRIQIFSKSGKDSTEDRKGLRGPKSWESLMMVYYDILLLDDRSLLDARHSERFKLLERVVHPSKGRAELVPRHVIDFAHGLAVSELRKAFANVIVNKGEGLVLKPDEPYFNFHHDNQPFGGRCVKLKKEYIGNLGDVGDFAVVGAGYLAFEARSYAISNLQWTHFYVGCLDNKEQVQRWNATPEFTVVSVVELNEKQLQTLVKFGNPLPIPLAENNTTRLKIPSGIQTGPPLAFVFRNPLVFDLRCFSFDKPGNTGFWTLRFPVVSKIHFDRDFSDTTSFEELQNLAKEATTAPGLEDSQENLTWIARLEGADPRGLPVDAVSQMTATTTQTPSPVRSASATSERDPSASPAIASQSLQACIGPKILGDCAQGRTMAAKSRLLPLMAPPMLPLPPRTMSRKALGDSPRKRPASLSVSLPPPHKRRRPSEPEATSTQVQNSPRQPLVDINDNASPHPAMICVKWAENDAAISTTEGRPGDDKQRALDEMLVETRSSKERENDTVSEKHEVCGDTTSKTSAKGTARTVTLENKHLENKHLPPRSGKQAPLGKQALGKQALGKQALGKQALGKQALGKQALGKQALAAAKPECRVGLCNEYNDGGCRGRLLIHRDGVPSGHVHDTRLSLVARRVRRVGTASESTRQLARAGSAPRASSKRGQAKILLVESVNNPAETRDILARIGEARDELPRRQRDLITVYDWRVLRHITVMEDESIVNKYYDGFQDPWRRWYCGII